MRSIHLFVLTALALSAACKDSTSAPPAAFVTGSVTSVKLGALAVRVRGTSGAGPADSALTDSVTGAYRALRLLPGNATVQVSVGPLGCTLPASQVAVVAANDTATGNIVVDCTGAIVYGRLSHATVGRMPGVTVSLTTNGVLMGSVQTDRGGLFSFNYGYGTGSGSFNVIVEVTAGMPANCTPPSGSFTLANGGSLEVAFTITCS